MFILFTRRLGCASSLIISVGVTILMLFLFGWI